MWVHLHSIGIKIASLRQWVSIDRISYIDDGLSTGASFGDSVVKKDVLCEVVCLIDLEKLCLVS